MQVHWYLITTHNHAAYLPDMFASIQRQYATHIEFIKSARLLFIDDASDDSTPDWIVNLSRQYPKNVFYLCNEVNQGIGRNRNTALTWLYGRQTHEDDVALFVDGDDILTDTHLRVKLDRLAAQPAVDCVGGQLALFYDDDPRATEVVDTFPTDPDIQAIAHIFECHVYISNTLFRLKALKSRLARFPETSISEDWQFFAGQAFRLEHVPDVTLLYRRHANNLSSSQADARKVFNIRKEARELTLRRIGMSLTDRDSELLDLVGYLSFRLRWKGGQWIPADDVQMPWFSHLEDQPVTLAHWASIKQEVFVLFTRLRIANEQAGYFCQNTLNVYLQAILFMANRACGKGLCIEKIAHEPRVEGVPPLYNGVLR